MAKNVFRDIRLQDIGKAILIDPEIPDEKTTKVKQLQLREKRKSEFAELKKKLEQEFIQRKKALEEKFEKIKQEVQSKKKAELEEQTLQWVEQKKQEAEEAYNQRVQEADTLCQNKLAQTETKVKQLYSKARAEQDKIKQEAYDKGYQQGKEEGYQSGLSEVKRLIDRLNTIVSEMIHKRNSIIEGLESQLIDIVILIGRKIVKTISEDHRRLVYENIKESLSILRGRARVLIRVNSEDLDMATHHKQEFIDMMESIESLKILEDNSIDKGGCHIDTEFGYIDARISSQLSEVEEQIKRMRPIQEEF